MKTIPEYILKGMANVPATVSIDVAAKTVTIVGNFAARSDLTDEASVLKKLKEAAVVKELKPPATDGPSTPAVAPA